MLWGSKVYPNFVSWITWCKVTSRNPMQSLIDTRRDLMSHQSEILHSLIFSYIRIPMAAH